MADKKHFPWNLNPTPEEAAFWRRWLYRRAAELFEENGEPVEAAECWVGAGFPDRAVELYAREGSYRTAADVLLEEKRTEEALSLCEVWRENAGAENVPAIVGSGLGTSACRPGTPERPAGDWERAGGAAVLKAAKRSYIKKAIRAFDLAIPQKQNFYKKLISPRPLLSRNHAPFPQECPQSPSNPTHTFPNPTRIQKFQFVSPGFLATAHPLPRFHFGIRYI